MQIDAEPPSRLCRRVRANPHIDADNQANPGSSGGFDHIRPHVVALANAVRHVKVRRPAAQFDRRLQNDDRHRAVDVVVAVNQHRLFAGDGGVDPVDRRRQPGHQLGRV